MSAPAEVSTCPGCGVAPGHVHQEGCDVARCPDCGIQRLQCEDPADTARWGTWTGEWPGVVECREFGWWARWTVVTEYSRDGRPDSGPEQRCGADDHDAHPDLNRLWLAGCSGELVWDKRRERWVRP